jgi:septal ring factor EnvC (AmiA/AmiB activator)
MNETLFQKRLAELLSEIATLPASQRNKLELMVADTKKRHKQLQASTSNVQESLDYLRVAIKYLLFDLEATRRENAYLRKMLQRRQGDKSP